MLDVIHIKKYTNMWLTAQNKRQAMHNSVTALQTAEPHTLKG